MALTFRRICKVFTCGLAGLLLLGGAAVTAMAAEQKAEAEKEKILDELASRAINGHVRPRYQRLADRSETLKNSLEALCAAPTEARLAEVRQHFNETVLAYAAVEHIRFGPAQEDYRLERLAYWPDRKGRGLRAVRKILKQKDKSNWDPDRLAKKSIAVQGLTALEFLLYGTGSESLAKEKPRSFRCRYSYGIAVNVGTMTKAIADGWKPDAPIVEALLHPSPEQKRYRNRAEVLLEFYQAVTVGLKSLHDLKMNPLLGRDAAHARPKRAAFWRSGLAVKVIRTNLEAVEDLVTLSGFRDLLPKNPVDLARYVDKVYQKKYATFDRFKLGKRPMPIEGVLRGDDSRAAFIELMKSVTHLNAGFARNFAVEADLPMGFNATDGD